jgi:hypothetical protein
MLSLLTTWALPQKLAVCAGAVALSFGLGYYKGRIDANASQSRAMVKATMEQLKERGQINADILESDIESICRELGGGDDCRLQADIDN